MVNSFKNLIALLIILMLFSCNGIDENTNNDGALYSENNSTEPNETIPETETTATTELENWIACKDAILEYYNVTRPSDLDKLTAFPKDKNTLDFLMHEVMAKSLGLGDIKEVYTNSYYSDYRHNQSPVGVFGRPGVVKISDDAEKIRLKHYKKIIEVELYVPDYYYEIFNNALYISMGDSSRIKFYSAYEEVKRQYFEFINSPEYKEHHDKKVRMREVLSK